MESVKKGKLEGKVEEFKDILKVIARKEGHKVEVNRLISVANSALQEIYGEGEI